jgi:hypothetical protein
MRETYIIDGVKVSATSLSQAKIAAQKLKQSERLKADAKAKRTLPYYDHTWTPNKAEE